MARRLLALNAGSATLKGATYELSAPGTATPRLIECSRVEIKAAGPPQQQLADLIDDLSETSPDVVVHRIVHGGDRAAGHELDDDLLAELDALAPLAPIHQPAALSLVREARLYWPHARHGVAFDTSFHASLAPWSRRLPIPADWDRLGVRRYGFHGLAFASALRILADEDKSICQGRAVLVHLGGGCSLCAVENGLSRDTTMALTPLGGVPSPARSGDLDPGALLYLLRQEGLNAHTLEDRLSHEAGLAGIAGHGDIRALLADRSPLAELAVEQFVIRIAQAIAAMATGIGGLEHLAFSGGIGHRSAALRQRIVERLGWLDLALDPKQNDAGALRIGVPGKTAIWNVGIDEERELAESALRWL